MMLRTPVAHHPETCVPLPNTLFQIATERVGIFARPLAGIAEQVAIDSDLVIAAHNRSDASVDGSFKGRVVYFHLRPLVNVRNVRRPIRLL